MRRLAVGLLLLSLAASCRHAVRRAPPFERLRALVGKGWTATDEDKTQPAELALDSDGRGVVQKLGWWARFGGEDGALVVEIDAYAGRIEVLRAPIDDDQALMFLFRPVQPVEDDQWAFDMTLTLFDEDHVVETWRYRDGPGGEIKVKTLRFSRR